MKRLEMKNVIGKKLGSLTLLAGMTLTAMSPAVLADSSNPLFFKQWGIENTGQPIYIRKNETSMPAQFGIKNTDINYVSEEELATKNSNEVVVAVIDTGVDIAHPDLEGRIWEDPNCTEENKNICKGKNILNPKAAPYDDKGHGTHVAGIIAANNNDKGILGVTAPNIKIMPIKVLNKKVDSFGYKGKNVSDFFAEGISFAARNNADVINMSVGFPKLVLTPKFRSAVKLAVSKNIPIIVAAGNNRKDIPVFPCSLNGIICVGAVDNRGDISTFSNYGHMVDILAPGQSIVSTYPVSEENGPLPSRKLRIPGYENMQGSSQASPYIAGVAAMIKSNNPGITLDELKARLLGTTKARKENKSEHFSLNGLVDMKKAVSGNTPAYVYPSFKENAQVIVKNKNLEFEYRLKVKKLSGEQDNISLKIKSSGDVKFFEKELSLEDVSAGQSKVFVLKGKFPSKAGHSVIPFVFDLTSNGVTREFKANLNFSLGITAAERISVPLRGVNPKLVFAKKGHRTFSLLKYVYSADNKVIDPEYFYTQKPGEEGQKSIFNLVRFPNKKQELIKMDVPAGEVVVNVIRGDLNLDKKDDYLILTHLSNEDTNSFYLNYLDQDLKPLLGSKSKFEFKNDSSVLLVKDGQNLLNFDKRLVNFGWLKHNVAGVGNVLLPVVAQNGVIANEDNSDEIIEFIFPSLSNKRYALTPEESEGKIVLKPRMLMNMYTEEEIRSSLYDLGDSVQPWESIKFESVASQPQDNNGDLTYIISVGELYSRRFFKIHFSTLGEFEIESIHGLNSNNNSLVLSGNSSFQYLRSPFAGKENIIFFKLDNRSTGRAAYLGSNGETISHPVNGEDYSDPLFGFISTTNINSTRETFFESRYWVHYFNGKQTMKFPVNRESSFPGVEFSETMEGVFGKVDGKFKHGVFVNSTLLYGNQVHAVFPVGDKLIRPIGFTIEIPKNCSYMLPTQFKDDKESYLGLNCIENNKSVVKFIPLSI